MRVHDPASCVTASDDPRITQVGRLLRRTKIDELPELWNLVRGDISLVGPRPEVPRYVDRDDPMWQRLLAVRPGITSPVTLELRNEEALLSAVQGDREAYYRDTLLPYKVRGNVRYLETRTWKTDVAVIARTLRAIAVPGPPPMPIPTTLREHG